MQERRKEVLKKDSGDVEERRQGIARNNKERETNSKQEIGANLRSLEVKKTN